MIPAPKRRRRKGGEPKPPTSPAAEPDAVPAVGTTYDTDVAPDLIEAGRSPDRSDVPESECSLPDETGAGTPD